jgi:hypothetical protein
MKRFMFIAMSLLALLLSACGAPPLAPTTEDPPIEADKTFISLEIELIGRKPWNWYEFPYYSKPSIPKLELKGCSLPLPQAVNVADAAL